MLLTLWPTLHVFMSKCVCEPLAVIFSQWQHGECSCVVLGTDVVAYFTAGVQSQTLLGLALCRMVAQAFVVYEWNPQPQGWSWPACLPCAAAETITKFGDEMTRSRAGETFHSSFCWPVPERVRCWHSGWSCVLHQDHCSEFRSLRAVS
jgi:hypothetical protein